MTRQATEDLALPAESFGRDATELIGLHPLVKQFVQLRGEHPDGQEIIKSIKHPRCWSLHAGDRWRGATWHDEEAGVVWLLAAGWHEEGSRRDAYKVFEARYREGRLAPTEQDYLDLEPEPRAFVELLAREAPELMERARNEPNVEHCAVLASTLPTSVYVEVIVVDDESASDVYVAFRPSDKTAGGAMPADWLVVCVAALLPDAQFEEVDFSCRNFPGRRITSGEMVLRWSRDIIRLDSSIL